MLNPKRIDNLPGNISYQIAVSIHADGAMSIAGPIHDTQWCIAVLEQALSELRSRHVRFSIKEKDAQLVVPERDLSTPELREKLVA